MPRGWGIARRSSAPPGLGVTEWGWGHGCSEDPEPLGRTHTRARTLHGGATWPPGRGATTRVPQWRGRGWYSYGPSGWRARGLGATEHVGSLTKRLREVSWSPWTRARRKAESGLANLVGSSRDGFDGTVVSSLGFPGAECPTSPGPDHLVAEDKSPVPSIWPRAGTEEWQRRD